LQRFTVDPLAVTGEIEIALAEARKFGFLLGR
jgi:hypothetical protein